MRNLISASLFLVLFGATANAQGALYNTQTGAYYLQPITVPSAAEIQAYQQQQQAMIQAYLQQQQQQQQMQQQQMQMMAGAIPSIFGAMGGGASSASRNAASATSSPAAAGGIAPSSASPSSAAATPTGATSPGSSSSKSPQAKGANPGQTSQPSNNPNDCNIVMDCKQHTISANVSGTALNGPIDCGKDTAADRDYNGKGHLGNPISAPLIGQSGNSQEIDITGIAGMGTCGGTAGASGAVEAKVLHVRGNGAAPSGSGGPGQTDKGSLGCMHISNQIMSALLTSCVGSSFTIQNATDPNTVVPPPPSCDGSQSSGSSGGSSDSGGQF